MSRSPRGKATGIVEPIGHYAASQVEGAHRGRAFPVYMRLTYGSYRFILLCMKVAVSLPDRVFEEAEKMSKRLRVSRSRLYAQALEEFVGRHRSKGVRATLEEVYEAESSDVDAVLADLQARALEEKW